MNLGEIILRKSENPGENAILTCVGALSKPNYRITELYENQMAK